ncbi:hypothetical protein BSFP_034890 [Burkholderia stabilis]|uniref:Uncharacterized protein n=1 Tax=Burkholderia stabilis TaxID=95485 RepID=A0A1Y1BQP2_9BURK|nr:hypothetical protein BSFP_034890 [Burkholderia stabilis]
MKCGRCDARLPGDDVIMPTSMPDDDAQQTQP